MSSMNRRQFLTQLGQGALGMLGAMLLPRLAWARAGASERPPLNVLFIICDDLGGHDPACYGNPFNETPCLDQLAREGMRFTDAYGAGPICTPARAGCVTGRYPARLHMTQNPGYCNPANTRLLGPVIRHELPLEEPTFADALKGVGDTTGIIGKWHLGNEGFTPDKHGFDTGSFLGLHYAQAGDYFSPYISPQHFPTDIPPGPPGEYLTDRLTNEAINYVTAHRDHPFMLYLGHYAPHTSIGNRLQGKPELNAKYREKAKHQKPPGKIDYASMIDNLDENIGRLLTRLRELHLDERTVVIFTADHGAYGYATSNAPFRAAKSTLYEGGLRIPLIIRWPGVVAPGSVCHEPVCSVDYYPTILDIAGATDRPNHTLDGASLLPLLQQTGTFHRDALYWHKPHYDDGGAPCGAIRAGDDKLLEFFEDNRLELYNLKDDLSETHNLAATLPEKARALQRKLAQWRQSVGAEMPVPNPNYA